MTIRAKAPIVYRFVCPRGHSYVGSTIDGRRRGEKFARTNARIEAAQVQPTEWRFEVLEQLQPGCSKDELQAAEQRHMDALQSRLPECGYNVLLATAVGPRPVGPRSHSNCRPILLTSSTSKLQLGWYPARRSCGRPCWKIGARRLVSDAGSRWHHNNDYSNPRTRGLDRSRSTLNGPGNEGMVPARGSGSGHS